VNDHTLDRIGHPGQVRYEERPVLDESGSPVPGLHNVWITLDNPKQFNSYTTDMVKEVILGFRRASCDRGAVAVVFTGVGHQAFCTGGNTKEYAEYYAGNPQEYRQYMRLFNDMVSAILGCDKPVICRVNGMRVAGGQEIGMACDYTVSSDLAVFGQAGPKHGSAPDGGATDFLPLFVGIERATESCTLCQTWSAHKAWRYGLVYDVQPALKLDGSWIPNPKVVTGRWMDELGRIVHGDFKPDTEGVMARATVDLSALDAAVEKLATRLAYTMPDCTTKTIESMRKRKLQHWDRNRETNRAWLALNMMTEAKAGFRAFNEGPKGAREVDFLELRRRLSQGEPWSDELIRAISPQYRAGAST